MLFGSGAGGARKSMRSRVALMRTRIASRAVGWLTACSSNASGSSIETLWPRSRSETPMLDDSASTGSVNSASSRVEMRLAS